MGIRDQFTESASGDVLYVKTPEGLKEVARRADAAQEEREVRVAMKISLACAAISFAAWMYHFLHQLPIVYTLFSKIPLNLNDYPLDVDIFLIGVVTLRSAVVSYPVWLVTFLGIGMWQAWKRMNHQALKESCKRK